VCQTPVCNEALGFEDMKNWAARQDLRAFVTGSCCSEGEIVSRAEIQSEWRKIWSENP
jgi:hypothetical protein